MDDKTLNLWRQIEGARRVGRRHVSARGKSDKCRGSNEPLAGRS